VVKEELLPLARKGDLAGVRRVLEERIDPGHEASGLLGAQLVRFTL